MIAVDPSLAEIVFEIVFGHAVLPFVCGALAAYINLTRRPT